MYLAQMTDNPVTVYIKTQSDKKHSVILGHVLENYFYFHLFVYVAMVNSTCSNISFKNCQQVCVLIQTPCNKENPIPLCIFLSCLCRKLNGVVWDKDFHSVYSSNRKKIFSMVETNHLAPKFCLRYLHALHACEL